MVRSWAWLIILVPILGVGVAVSGLLSDEAGARRVLEGQGIKVTSVGGYDFLGCSEDDQLRTRFEGVGPTGQPVSGVVCDGWFKGATIRFD